MVLVVSSGFLVLPRLSALVAIQGGMALKSRHVEKCLCCPEESLIFEQIEEVLLLLPQQLGLPYLHHRRKSELWQSAEQSAHLLSARTCVIVLEHSTGTSEVTAELLQALDR